MAEKIQEFLAELGFKVDQSGLRIMETALGQFAKGTLAMVTAFSAGMTTIVLGLRKVASTYEQLYYIAQRSGASVEGLRELEYAFGQIGMSAGDAAQAVEGIAAAMRSNPGMEGMLKALGVQTRTANGAMRDTTQITVDLVKRLAQMPFYVAKQYAAMFGISERTLIQMEQHIGDIDDAEKRYRETAQAAGLDQEKLAAESREFMNEWRTLSTDIEVAFATIAEQSLPALTEAMKKAGAFIVSHFGDIKSIAHQVGDVFTEDAGYVTQLLSQINDLVKSTTGWKHALELVAVVISYQILGPIGAILTTIKELTDYLKENYPKQYNDMVKGLNHPANPAKPMTPAERKKFEDYMWEINPFNWLGRLFHKTAFEDGIGQGGIVHAAFRTALPEVASPNASGALGIRNNNPGNLRWASGAVGTNHGFAVFKTAAEGLVALHDNLMRYASKGIDTIAGIVNRWAPPSDNNPNNAAYMARIAKELGGVGINQHLNMRDPAVLSKIMRGIIAFENGGIPYTDAQINGAAGLRLGTGGVQARGAQVHQENHIKIDGAHNPVRTGQEVAQAQRRVNADLIRNLTGAVVA